MIHKNSNTIFLLSLACVFLTSCQPKQTSSFETIGYLEKLSEEFDEIVPPNTVIEVIATGHNWTEGPVWLPKEKCLIYSDVPENIAFKWTEENGSEEYLSPSGYSGEGKRVGSNGLTLDQNGKLILCKSGDREVARLVNYDDKSKPVFQILANSFEGKKFNSPNDVVMDKKGNFYFTDPPFGLKDSTLKEMDYHGVFRIGTDGSVRLLTKNCPTPNGIGLSPDNKTLYVANTRPPKLFAWDLSPSGEISNERLLFDVEKLWNESKSKQPPDGMAINRDGIIFMTGPDGVLIFSPKGKHLGTIKTDKRTSNCTFDETETVLYVSCDDLMLRVDLKR